MHACRSTLEDPTVDQIDQDIGSGHAPWDAVVGATVRRFRPIVLTAAAAVLALIPLVRSDFFGPMAVAMMGGIVVATVLTLVFLPALYASWFRVSKQGRPEGEQDPKRESAKDIPMRAPQGTHASPAVVPLLPVPVR